MDEEGLNIDAEHSKEEFFNCNVASQNSTNENWTLLKAKIDELLISHVPEKVIRQRWDVPLMTQPIRKLISKKKLVYNPHKHHKSSKMREKFTKLRKTVQKQLQCSKNEYLIGLLDSDNQNSCPSVGKKFWGHLKKPQTSWYRCCYPSGKWKRNGEW